MVSSLKDALLGAGLKAPEPKKKPQKPHRPTQAGKPKPNASAKSKPKRPKLDAKALQSDENVSLAAAYKARTAQEQRERDLAKRKKQAEAKAKRERIQAVLKLIEGKTLNREDAEESRYFEYARKIRRVYVTAEQQEQLNSGELGVVQSKGRYYIVAAAIAKAVQEAAPEFLALLQAPENGTEEAEASPDPTAD